MEPRALIDFLRVMERLKDAPRHCWTTGGRRESVAEHSWRVALMAMLMADEFPEADMDKVIRMCLIHDIGEAITGDIPTFLKTDADRVVEGKEVDALIGRLPAPWPQTLGALKSEGVGAIAYHKFHTSHIRCLEVAYKVLTVGSVAGNEDGNVHLSEELGVL